MNKRFRRRRTSSLDIYELFRLLNSVARKWYFDIFPQLFSTRINRDQSMWNPFLIINRSLLPHWHCYIGCCFLLNCNNCSDPPHDQLPDSSWLLKPFALNLSKCSKNQLNHQPKNLLTLANFHLAIVFLLTHLCLVRRASERARVRMWNNPIR